MQNADVKIEHISPHWVIDEKPLSFQRRKTFPYLNNLRVRAASTFLLLMFLTPMRNRLRGVRFLRGVACPPLIPRRCLCHTNARPTICMGTPISRLYFRRDSYGIPKRCCCLLWFVLVFGSNWCWGRGGLFDSVSNWQVNNYGEGWPFVAPTEI